MWVACWSPGGDFRDFFSMFFFCVFVQNSSYVDETWHTHAVLDGKSRGSVRLKKNEILIF